jgi:hypothetical protein
MAIETGMRIKTTESEKKKRETKKRKNEKRPRSERQERNYIQTKKKASPTSR